MSEQEKFRDDRTEFALLGAVVADPVLLPMIAPRLAGADDFGLPAHGAIWSAASSILASGRTVDITTLSAMLKERNAYGTVTNAVRFDALPHMRVSFERAESYAKIVAENGRARRVANALRRATIALERPTVGASPFVEFVSKEIRNASIAADHLVATPLAEIAMEFSAHLDALKARAGKLDGLTTGLFKLDRITCGIRGGQLIIAAGRPGMGKTALVLDIMRHVAEIERQFVGFFSLEMPRTELWERMCCSRANVDANLIHANELTKDHRERLDSASNELSMLPMEIFDRSQVSVDEIRGACLRLKATKGLGLVIVDYLTLIDIPSNRDSMASRVGDAAQQFKDLAKELKCPVILLSQLNRKCEDRPDKRPNMGDLRESGEIEQHADCIWLIYRDEVYDHETEDKGIAEIIIPKQRGGLTGVVRTQFIKHLTKFSNLESDMTHASHAERTLYPVWTPRGDTAAPAIDWEEADAAE